MFYLHSRLRCLNAVPAASRTGAQQMRRRSSTIFAALGSLAGRRQQPSTAATTADTLEQQQQQSVALNLEWNGQANSSRQGEAPVDPSVNRPYSSLTSASPKGVELPQEVTKRLGTLKRDVLDALMDHQVAEGLSALADNPLQFTRNLQEMAKYYFGQGGKLIRPTISLLMSAACNQARISSLSGSSAQHQKQQLNPTKFPSSSLLEEISLNQYRIAMVAEMIHNATLVHDDVIDESDTRRGKPTVNARWGNKQAVLVGDFILARATKVLCSIGQPRVIETMAEIVEDLVKGELMQLNAPARESASSRFHHYMVKTFYKTGSLFANSCKSVAMLSGCDDSAQQLATEFGRNLGLAFQFVDDVLDYVASASELGKPTGSDLRLGLATCPVLFAAREHPELETLIERRFGHQGDIEHALELVHHSKGLANSRELALQHGEAAIGNVMQLLPHGGHVRDCLVDIVLRQLDRDR